MKKCIVSTHYNRPICSNWHIQSLKECENIDEWDLFFFAEPTMYSVAEILSSSNFKNYNVIINKKLFGKNKNRHEAIRYVIKNYDYVLFLEDDVILSTDALKLTDWVISKDNLKNHSFSPYSYFNKDIYDKENNFKLRYYNDYIPFALGFWTESYINIKNFKQVRPIISRANNIGFIQGEVSDESLRETVKGLGHDVYNVNRLYCNPLGREWLKLDNDSIMSRPDISIYIERLMHRDWSKTLLYDNKEGEYDI